ncbi:hypothetical protein C4K39_4034 [Pseudomonas sessilinigenes]|nr:hypothetical protein C4K39_4034 [Pseudomonas sessilinigenes]
MVLAKALAGHIRLRHRHFPAFACSCGLLLQAGLCSCLFPPFL